LIAPTRDPACIADWDSVSYTTSTPHCLRRVDLDRHYPEDLNGGIYHDSAIWSRALWEIRNELGHVMADTLILEAQFSFAADSSMPAAAQVIVDTAKQLYSPGAAKKVRAIFETRGIL
jgi:Zn-dependent metalloprotease